ncbi:MAG: hypothetical protein ACYC5F_04715, partial [Thermoleophilia bacterium]
MVLMPLALLIVVAIATSGAISAGSAQYFVYHQAPPPADGVSNQLLYVAGGTDSDVKVVDVGTMSIVDKIPVPVQPDGLAGLGMHWEVHGVVPAADRGSIYAVGALSGGYLAAAPYQMYNISTSTKTLIRQIPLGDSATNPVGYCGLEYNLNDESSNEIIAASMNAADGTLVSFGAPNLGRTDAQQQGGWSFENIATGTNTGFMSTNFNATNESSTCGIAWNADGTRGFASQMFEPLVDKVNWTTRAADGEIAAYSTAGTSYHQTASDKAAGRLYVTSSSGNIDIFDMNTGAQLGQINIRSLTGTPTNDVHGVEVAPGQPNILYVTSRHTPDGTDNMELVVNVTNPAAPTLDGAVGGMGPSACGVYADANKSLYYTAANPTPVGNQMLFVANGQASDVKVIDVGTMSIVDTLPVPVQPNGLAGLGMKWEIHGVVAGKDRTNVYAVGALSGGYLAGAPYVMYDVNTATKAADRQIPLGDSATNPVGYCGLEYNLNDESSNEIIAASMNAADGTL